MKILILGATGRVGSHLLKYILNDGHHVTALVRMPEKIQMNNEKLTIIQGDVLDKDAIVTALHDIDVVISALNTDGTTTLSKSMPLIIEAMQNRNIQRIITIGTAGILQSRNTSGLLRYQSSESKQKSARAAIEHHKVYELLNQSNLDWTIVCPTYLPDTKRLGTYRIERNFLPIDGKEISVADTAEFAFSLIQSRDFLKTRIGIAY
ncbi:SDR family oxidoreductase [Metasolibacillus meyeri]|uniref:SDR family oxidoreductase n=1 Tax=Metasolibacillus meyeri TaxID=1071052 RepID=A0AAW9NFH6_9BACL|nr:SDR family oxidoreductase [Metasolibacillus meyeri]MEC1177199.1 SDR family oxidoreductase [Metasolibacillus meyeri]